MLKSKLTRREWFAASFATLIALKSHASGSAEYAVPRTPYSVLKAPRPVSPAWLADSVRGTGCVWRSVASGSTEPAVPRTLY
jgi:hypothetical protein